MVLRNSAVNLVTTYTWSENYQADIAMRQLEECGVQLLINIKKFIRQLSSSFASALLIKKTNNIENHQVKSLLVQRETVVY